MSTNEGTRRIRRISGATPEETYLDVIPEDKALYRSRGPKRKLPSKQEQQWQYRERRQISMDSICSTISESSSGSESDSDDEPSDPAPLFNHPITRPKLKPTKRRRRYHGYYDIIDQIDDLMKEFRLTDDTYEDISQLLAKEMEKGLKRESHYTSTVRMYPTYVRSLPDGSEFGRYMALDLGGTNFRVLLVDLKGTEEPKITSKIFLIPKTIMLGSGDQLFDHIATCMGEFMDQEVLKKEKLPLGFTFSFPCYQEGLASARLVRWTKGFRCAGVEGQDVVRLLLEAVSRRGDYKIDCSAIINDPVGALMSGAHTDPHCKIGLILGTGTNCCYMEKLDEVDLWNEDRNKPKQVIINTEWGAFGDNGVLDFVRNSFDRELDKRSLNPGHQLFEKMISGMYMGEVVRLVLCELTSKGLLFSGEQSDDLFTPNQFLTKYVSEIESDDPNGSFPNTKLVLQEMDIPHFTMDDCRHVQHVCWQVSQRAAFLAATAVATVVKRLDLPVVTVAVDGSLYRFHPHFKDLMKKKIKQLVGDNKTVNLELSHDGSGKGAALVAAVAQKQKNIYRQSQESSDTTKATNESGDSKYDIPSSDLEKELLSEEEGMATSE